MYAIRVNKNTTSQVQIRTHFVRSDSDLAGFFIGDKTMKAIPNCPGYYANTEGSIFSDCKRIPNQPQGLIKLKQSMDSYGYLVITIRNNPKKRQGKVHRLIAQTFLPNPLSYPLVRHLDDNKQNNHISNLAWGTPRDNSSDMIKNGGSLKGTKNHEAKLNATQVQVIRYTAKTGKMTQQAITDNFGITKGHVNNIIARRVWKHV